MGDSEFTEAESVPRSEVWELRRNYHDRIAEVKQRSVEILTFPTTAVEVATHALMAGDAQPVARMRVQVDELRSVVAAIDVDVVGLLALESPVARDLRLILASRDVAQVGLLCAGLCVTLAGRAGGVAPSAVPPVDGLLSAVSTSTADVLAGALRAWTAIDRVAAIGLAEPILEARRRQTELVAGVLELRDVPIDAALDLALATRAFDRLVDHAEEIADRVLFAAGPAGVGSSP